jgi:hypothetical protein
MVHSRRDLLKYAITLLPFDGRDVREPITVTYERVWCTIECPDSEVRVLFYVTWQSYLWKNADKQYEHYNEIVKRCLKNDGNMYSLQEPLGGQLHRAVEHAIGFLNWRGHSVRIRGYEHYVAERLGLLEAS